MAVNIIKNKWLPGFTGLALALALLPACSKSSQGRQAAAAPLVVQVSIGPLAYLVSRVGWDGLKVEVVAPREAALDSYIPGPGRLARIQKSRMFFRVGAPYEPALAAKLARTGGPKVVDLRKGVALLYRDKTGRGSPDYHIWLDPKNITTIARTIATSLATLNPKAAPQLDRNLQELLKEVESLDQELATIMTPIKGQELYVSHQGFAYFCRRYGLTQVPLTEAYKLPAKGRVQAFISKARKAKATALFILPGQAEAVQALAGQGISVVSLDPMALEYAGNLRQIAATLLENIPAI